VVYNFQTGNNKIKLLTEYENVTRIVRDFLTCVFLGAGLGVVDKFHDLRAHPIIRRLISSCGDTLRACLQDPCDLPHELKLRIVASIETVTLQMLENLWREIEYSFDILRGVSLRHVSSKYFGFPCQLSFQQTATYAG
jgi:hypothetical protein